MPAPFQLTSVHISPFCELARWVLEQQGIEYHESCHAPIWNVPYTKAAGNTLNVPVVQAPDATFEIREFLNYIDARARAADKLFPVDAAQRADSDAFVHSTLTELAIAIRLYAYANMLPKGGVTGPLMTANAPWWERVLVKLFYPLQANAMRKVLKISPATVEQARTLILSSFDTISKRIEANQAANPGWSNPASSKTYLFGDKLSGADLVFAAGTAPITLPPEYGAPFPSYSDSPPQMQATVTAVQATPAGQLALRIYRESRVPAYKTAPISPSTGLRWRDRFGRWFQRVLANPTFLRIAGKLLRVKPVLKVGKLTVVSGYKEVVKVLTSDQDYTIAEMNAANMNRICGPFILGMDRSPQYERENTAIRSIVKPTDLEWVRQIVSGTAQSLLTAAQPYGRIDVSGSYARICAARVVAEYFGVPGPSEHILMRWLRSLFWDVFLNRAGAPLVRRAATTSAQQLREYLTALIAQRASEGATGDDFLSRLVQAGTLDPEGIRRNVTGIIVGAIETTVTAATNAIDVLLKKPNALAQTRIAAQAGDVAPLRQCVYEAMRFNPQAPALLRHSKADNTTVFAMTIAAMFDPAAFPDPDRFVANRPLDRYLHFGYGMHTCYGAMINGVQLPELARGIVQLPNLRRASGRFAKTLFEGPFPDRLVVEWGPEAAPTLKH